MATAYVVAPALSCKCTSLSSPQPSALLEPQALSAGEAPGVPLAELLHTMSVPVPALLAPALLGGKGALVASDTLP